MSTLIHFSDLHYPLKDPHWKLPDIFSKRGIAWLNYQIGGRRKKFQETPTIVEHFASYLQLHAPDLLVFTGDASTFGTAQEFQRIRRYLDSTALLQFSGICTPGNHDRYVRKTLRATFETTFHEWLPKLSEDNIFPYVHTLPEAHLIVVNSAVPNRMVWDSRGKVSPSELERLKSIFKELDVRPRILVTHYPMFLANGAREKKLRRLRNDQALYHLAVENNIQLWLHGHRHHGYLLRDDTGLLFACSGSLTQTGCRTFFEIDLTHAGFQIKQFGYEPVSQTFLLVSTQSFAWQVHD